MSSVPSGERLLLLRIESVDEDGDGYEPVPSFEADDKKKHFQSITGQIIHVNLPYAETRHTSDSDPGPSPLVPVSLPELRVAVRPTVHFLH